MSFIYEVPLAERESLINDLLAIDMATQLAGIYRPGGDERCFLGLYILPAWEGWFKDEG